MSRHIISVMCFLLLIGSGKSANIFFFFGLATYSHRITVWPLVQALVDRGHNITFASGQLPKQPDARIQEFCPAQFKAKLGAETGNFGNFSLVRLRMAHGRFLGGQTATRLAPELAMSTCDDFLSDPESQALIKNSKFDLVIIDGLYNECGLGIASKWGAKTILFGTTHPFPWIMEPFGVVPETSVYSDLFFSYGYPLSFLEKTFGTLVHLAWYFHRHYITFPKLEELLRKKLEIPEMPALNVLQSQIGVELFNSHFSEELARSLPPFFVPVGGMHCDLSKDVEPMPEEIRKFIDESGEAGFMLVSFGSLVDISDSEKLQAIIFTALERSKIRIILKTNGERPKEFTSNILTVGWYPQNQVLASRNIKAFISHGGLLSMQEALTHGVPMLAFPVFAEQDYNAFRLERTGRGIRLDMASVTLEELESAISKILTDKSYKQNVQKISRLFNDRPAKPVETAVWWTEYVLRHADTSHLKLLSMEQVWFQRRLLDVWAFIFVSLIVTIYLLFLSFRTIVTCLFSNPKTIPQVEKIAAQSKSKSKSKKDR